MERLFQKTVADTIPQMIDDRAHPSTLGGPGWRARKTSHAEEMGRGDVWKRCGLDNEYQTLRAILISRPSPRLADITAPNEWLMLEKLELPKLETQMRSIASFFESHGVAVHVDATGAPPPNYLFMRDLFFMTPQGAVLARPAAEQRASEERYAAAALAALGVPILRTMVGSAHFEGADALWIRPDHVLVGVGRRTNEEALHELRAVLAKMGVTADSVEVPAHAQHLLGLLVPVDDRTCLVDAARTPEAIKRRLQDLGMTLLELEDRAELSERRAMNVVVLGPRRLVMPAGCPRSRRALENAGIEIFELEVGEYIKAGGALGCLVGIVHRDA
jgi:N-dimethylarginine dimethylaminohydrolase